MYIILVGGGKVGYYLTKTLINEGYEVFLIEKNPIKCHTYGERFGSVIMQGDGAEAVTLAAAGAARADVVIAVTGEDEDNLVICQMAKEKFHVGRTIARVNNPKNEELFRRLGIDVTVSQTNVILSLIEQQIPNLPFVHLMSLRHADLAIVEAKVAEHSPILDRPIEKIELPPETIVTAIVRKGGVIIPTGQTIVRSGDELICVTKREREEALQELLGI